MVVDGLSGGGTEGVLLALAQRIVSQSHQVSIFLLRDVCDYSLLEEIEYNITADHVLSP